MCSCSDNSRTCSRDVSLKFFVNLQSSEQQITFENSKKCAGNPEFSFRRLTTGREDIPSFVLDTVCRPDREGLVESEVVNLSVVECPTPEKQATRLNRKLPKLATVNSHLHIKREESEIQKTRQLVDRRIQQFDECPVSFSQCRDFCMQQPTVLIVLHNKAEATKNK